LSAGLSVLRKRTGLGRETYVCTGAVTEAVALNKQAYSVSAQWQTARGKAEPRSPPQGLCPKNAFVLTLQGKCCSDRVKKQSKSK